ncbi:MAG: CDP-archaeol synthase [Pseudomonadota bacterium]
MLLKRIISALILIPLAVAVVLLGSWWFAGAILIISAMMLYEWFGVTGAKALWAATAALIAIWVAIAAHGSVALSIYLLIMGSIGSAFICLVRGGEEVAKWVAIGLAYISIPMVALIWLIETPNGSWVVLWLLVVVWVTDIAAYTAGRLIGGPKLAPAISPGKTWAGALGGLIGAVVVAVFATPYMLAMESTDAVLLAAALSVVAQCGDLAESWFKRRFDKKDSGTLIPGHGGVMDRVDGLVAAAPVLAIVIAFSPSLVAAAGAP